MTRRLHSLRASALLASALLALLGGCAASVDRAAAPIEVYETAEPPGFADIRFWGDRPAPDFAASARAAGGPGDVLVLSGGGPDGAFGAGVLNGWTERGDRPVFSVVTGVSVGALMAPYAFLGSAHDGALKDMFLSLEGPEDLFEIRVLSALAGGLSFASGAPLSRLIADRVDAALLDAIAEEHRRGRRLFVGTTNLDARRPVVWDMGAIADSGAPGRLALFRAVLLASATLPGVTEPVYIDVAIGGARYQEMHVDGGVTASIAIPQPSPERVATVRAGRRSTIYAIQNNRIVSPYGPADDTLAAILRDSLTEMIRSQSRGDQLRLFVAAERAGFDYRMIAVPKRFDPGEDAPFSAGYYRRMYEVGFELGLDPDLWLKRPPEPGEEGVTEVSFPGKDDGAARKSASAPRRASALAVLGGH